jgi:hypothetical protein
MSATDSEDSFSVRELAYVLVVVAVVAAGAVAAIIAADGSKSDAIAAIAAAVISVIGTLVGAVTGHRLGSAGRRAAEARGRRAEQRVAMYRAHLDDATAALVEDRMREMS